MLSQASLTFHVRLQHLSITAAWTIIIAELMLCYGADLPNDLTPTLYTTLYDDSSSPDSMCNCSTCQLQQPGGSSLLG